MKTMKITVVLVLMFVLTMAAGVVMGRLVSREPRPHGPVQRVAVVGVSPLSEELQLSAEQREQMRPIWEEARDIARSCAADGEQVQRQHEEQLKALLTEDQKRRYEQISQENHRKIADLDEKRKDAFRQAVERTRKILREDQWHAYEQIISNQVGTIAATPDTSTNK